MFSGKIKKQDAIKIGITIVLLVIAITLSMKFTLGSVAEISHEAKLSGYYDNGITNHTFTLSFSFDLHENESYPRIREEKP